eukprot:CAMPEP_0114519348 /NCGR_PEP_ID=MMETSP0109-20121206/18952_1 /TAXON_ID=29199 /ORGANISM="Chlorarachnion reptans, Strain CCCM449" /LENGTH=141 /DNA_ID=CAMNT_0001700075 /DNA_START=19 /DNA_END=444 /DNA_ORIENTATION=+
MAGKVDTEWAEGIRNRVEKLGISTWMGIASAHKSPRKVLELLDKYNQRSNVVYVTIAGLSNGLSGMVAANTHHVTIACPVFDDKVDMMVNIHSTLQMPPGSAVLTVLDRDNCAISVHRILSLTGYLKPTSMTAEGGRLSSS